MSIEDIGGPPFAGYLRKPIPDPLDAPVGAVVRDYEHASPAERAALLEQVSKRPEAGDTLAVYAERMATFAVREASSEPIRAGLIAIGLASPGVDYRYNVIATALLYHSAGLVCADWLALVEDVAPLIPPRPLERFRVFPTWGKVQRVEGMGYTPEGAGREFRYRPIPPRE